jgi:DNA-binding MarR family transcriptional regulator
VTVPSPQHIPSLAGVPRDISGDDLLDGLRSTLLAIKRSQAALLKARGISFTEWTALQLCAAAPARLGELAERIGLTPAGVTDLIDRLESRHLLRRAQDPEDRRAIRVALTPPGERLWSGTRDTLRGTVRRWMDQLTPEERAGLARGLAGLERVHAPPEGSETP